MDVRPLPGIQPVAAAVAAPMSAETSGEHREVISAIKAVNKAELLGENELAFQLDSESRRPVILIVNRTTREVIEQIPPEYLLRVAAGLASAR